MRMCKLKSLLAMMALAGGAVFAFGADKDGQPETEVSRTVYGGDHEATVNFDNDVAADKKSHPTKAHIASPAEITEATAIAEDVEFRWDKPTQVSKTKVEIDGTVKIVDGKDKGYRSKFKGKVGGNGGKPGDNTWDFTGRLRQKCQHKFIPDEMCEFDIIEKIVIGRPAPASENRNGNGGIAKFRSFGCTYIENRHQDQGRVVWQKCEICGKEVQRSDLRKDHCADDFIDPTNRLIGGDYEIYCGKCKKLPIKPPRKTCKVRALCIAEHKCERPADTCTINFVDGENRIISDGGNTITVLVGDREAMNVVPAHYALQSGHEHDYGQTKPEFGEPCDGVSTLRIYQHSMRNYVNFNRPGFYEIECTERDEGHFGVLQYTNRRKCGVKKKVIVREAGVVESVTVSDCEEGHENRKVTIPKGRNANNAERLEVVLPEKGSVAVRFKANCADPFVPHSPKWTHANGVETGPEVVIEFHKAGLQAIAFDTGNKEHMDVWVDVKPHSFKRTTTLHPDLVFRSAAKALNDALANSPTVVPRITPPSGTVSRTYYGWVELANSPKTFEQVSYNGGLDPAFGAALRVRTPTPVPAFMRTYINAEAFAQAGFELSLPMIQYTYDANEYGTYAKGKWSPGCDG